MSPPRKGRGAGATAEEEGLAAVLVLHEVEAGLGLGEEVGQLRGGALAGDGLQDGVAGGGGQRLAQRRLAEVHPLQRVL